MSPPARGVWDVANTCHGEAMAELISEQARRGSSSSRAVLLGCRRPARLMLLIAHLVFLDIVHRNM